MVNLIALTSAAYAAEYIDKDNYYLENGQALANYVGKGADALGLAGQKVEIETLTRLLDGHLPNGERIGKTGNKHRAGWDLTISAPKSVSIMGLLAGDERIKKAHDDAVMQALEYYEKYTVTRQRDENQVIQIIPTHSLVAAVFQHNTSRELDMQLHSHCLIMNMTQYQGKFVALSSESLFRLQHTLDHVYKTELSASLQKLGYETRSTDVGFELTCVPDNIIQQFSKRNQQVEQALKDKGIDRDSATPDQRQIATLATRKLKEKNIDEQALWQHWQSESVAHDWIPQVPILSKNLPVNEQINDHLLHTIKVLSEQDALISLESIYRHINNNIDQAINWQDMQTGIQQLIQQGELEARKLPAFDRHARTVTEKDAITTRDAVEREKQMLALARTMNLPEQPSWWDSISDSLKSLVGISKYYRGGAILSQAAATKHIALRMAIDSQNGKVWTEEQRHAAVSILSHRGKLMQLQGYAGTAKTSSVLKNVCQLSQQQGHIVVAIAPSHSAANQLQSDISADAKLTTSGYLAEMKKIDAGKADHNNPLHKALLSDRVLVIHDEAGLASSEQMLSLLSLAHDAGHRVINSGDRYQKSSIGAGSAFGQLIDNQVPTFELTHIFRQLDEQLKEAVTKTLPKDPQVKKVMALLQSGNRLTEIKDYQQRIQQIAEHVKSLTEKQRKATLVLDPSRKGVADLNSAIRVALQEKGQLAQDIGILPVLVARDISQQELKHGAIQSVFRQGDFITLGGNTLKLHGKYLGCPNQQLTKGNTWRVLSVQPDNATITLVHSEKNDLSFTINRKQLVAAYPILSEMKTIPISKGDQLRFTSSQPTAGFITNQRAIIEKINLDDGVMLIKNTDTGKELKLSLTSPQPLDHAYATTTFRSQGQTVRNVIYHAQSSCTNLMNQRDFYVGLSRATHDVHVFTDKKAELTKLIEKSTGEKMVALSKEQQKEIKRER